MKRIKTTEIIIETDEIFVLRARDDAAPPVSDCPACGAQMTTPEEAARLSNLSPRHVYRLVEAGHAHYAEMPDGGLLACLGSLGAGGREPAPLALDPSPAE